MKCRYIEIDKETNTVGFLNNLSERLTFYLYYFKVSLLYVSVIFNYILLSLRLGICRPFRVYEHPKITWQFLFNFAFLKREGLLFSRRFIMKKRLRIVP